jgi:chloramphenicol 3-O phosphotransferase
MVSGRPVEIIPGRLDTTAARRSFGNRVDHLESIGSIMTARIVLLNGVGSAGKSSIAKALQGIASAPFLHVAMDTFLDMLPPAYGDHPDGLLFETIEEDGHPSVVITSGPVADRTFQGMRHAIAAMAAQGNNMIVDEVLIDTEKAEYADLLAPYDLMTISVFCPLDVLEARERARGDRLIGLARWQYDRVHRDMTYDLTVNTSQMTALACAELIKKKFQL